MTKLKSLFRDIDTNGNHQLDLDEFERGLTKFGFFLKKHEYKLLFKHFDTNKNGTLDYEEFANGITMPLNERRLAFVKKIYRALDIDGSGDLTVEDFATRLDFSRHPDVLSGKKTQGDLIVEYMAPFETHQKDQKITEEEFIQYYTEWSLTISNDDYFVDQLETQWKITEKDDTENVQEQLKQLLTQIREKLLVLTGGNKDDVTLKKLFDRFDRTEDGYISFDEFENLISKLQISYNKKLSTLAFHTLDKIRNGYIDFNEFSDFVLRDPLSGQTGSTKRF